MKILTERTLWEIKEKYPTLNEDDIFCITIQTIQDTHPNQKKLIRDFFNKLSIIRSEN